MAGSLTTLASGVVQTGTEITSDAFTAPASGTIIIATMVAASTKASDPTGFTLLESQVNSHAHYVWYKVSDGTETSVTFNVNVSSPSNHWIGALTGVTGTPTHDSDATLSPGVQTSATPALNAASASFALASFGATAGDATSLTDMTTMSNSFTEIVDSRTSAEPNMAMADGYKASVTGSTSCTGTWTGADVPGYISSVIVLFEESASEEPSGDYEELQHALQRVSGTTLDAQGAANAWAGTSGLELLGALNAKAGTSGLGLIAVCNVLAGTTGEGHGVNYCAARFTS